MTWYSVNTNKYNEYAYLRMQLDHDNKRTETQNIYPQV